MCYKDRCCCCIPVEVGSLILGVFASIINAIGIVGCIGGLIYVNGYLYNDEYMGCVGSYCASYTYDGRLTTHTREALITLNVALSIPLVLIIIDFAFSVTLADGASKKNAGQIMTYFVYGVVKNVLAVIGIIISSIMLLFPVAILLTISTVIYGLLLVMVYKTHTKFTGGFMTGGFILKNEDQVQLV